MRTLRSVVPVMLLAGLTLLAPAHLDARQTPPGSSSAPRTHLLLITGLSGDAEHRETFRRLANGVLDAATARGIPPAQQRWLAETADGDPRVAGRATREQVAEAFDALARASRPGDDILVVLIGHGSAVGATAAFNLPGPDLTATDYAPLLARLTERRVAFINTASASGPFVAALSGTGRTIITATASATERNETRFADVFVAALADAATDRDRDGRLSLQEVFDATTARVKALYEQEGHLLTEHAQLDDQPRGTLAGVQYFAQGRPAAERDLAGSPARQRLLDERDALERQVNDLRLRKDTLPAAEYERQLDALLTALAATSRALRDSTRTP